LAFPPHLLAAVYSTNIGLALKRVPHKASPDFRDININILSGIYRAKTRPIPLRYILLPLALIMAVVPLFPLYQVKSQADTENLRLQTELSGVGQELRQARLALNEAKQIEDTINRIVADRETLEWEHQYILSKRGDFAHNLELVNHAFPSDAYFTSIEIGTGQITVEGEADKPFTVLIYTTALEGQGSFSEVRIAGIDESTETKAGKSTGVSFTIVISK
jgi:Tfp pilus assembly protein PilN